MNTVISYKDESGNVVTFSLKGEVLSVEQKEDNSPPTLTFKPTELGKIYPLEVDNFCISFPNMYIQWGMLITEYEFDTSQEQVFIIFRQEGDKVFYSWGYPERKYPDYDQIDELRRLINDLESGDVYYFIQGGYLPYMSLTTLDKLDLENTYTQEDIVNALAHGVFITETLKHP